MTIDYDTLNVWFLIIKAITTILVFMLLLSLIYKNTKRKEPLLRTLIFMFFFYEISFFASLWATVNWVIPNFWIVGTFYNESFKVWVTTIGLGFGSVAILFFSLNVYFTGRYERLKKIVFFSILFLNIIMAIISAIYSILNLSIGLFVIIVSLTILAAYLISLLGWVQTRLNMTEEMLKESDTFIHRFNLIGAGKLLIIIGYFFIFLDIVLPKTDPNTLLSFVGWIILFIGIVCFYIAFQKSSYLGKSHRETNE